LIRYRARRVTIDGDIVENASLPDDFWSNEGREPLQEDWDAGDFVSSFDGLTQSRAFGVQFEASDVLQLVPFEERAVAARSLSVAGNSAWVSARAARQFAYETAGLQPAAAGRAIVEQCRLGFISGRAVEMRWALGDEPGDWTTETREWDIPTWFWEDFTASDASTQDWTQGLFSGRGRSPQGYGWMTLNGVHFLRSSLEVLLPSMSGSEDRGVQIAPPKPNLPEADLRRWWDKLAKVREHLSQEQLRALAASDHPQHTVSRDRIRALAGGRKPGPRTG
jgi:hypothetical protein